MPGLAVGDIVQVTFDYLHFDQQLMNVVHFRVVTADPVGTISTQTQKIADDFGDWADPGSASKKLIDILPGTCTLRQVRAQPIYPVRYSYRFVDVYQVGLQANSKTPNLDVVITKRTDLTGDGMQSSFYLPGLPDDQMINGLIFNEYVTLVDSKTDWLDTLSPIAGTDIVLAPVIFHRANGTTTDITDHAVHNTVRVMNRRTVGFGI